MIRGARACATTSLALVAAIAVLASGCGGGQQAQAKTATIPLCQGDDLHLSAGLARVGHSVSATYGARNVRPCRTSATGIPIRLTLADEAGHVRLPVPKLNLLPGPTRFGSADAAGTVSYGGVYTSRASGALKRWCSLGGSTFTLTVSAPGARSAEATARLCK
jgi:hypothetical protein